MGTWNCNVFLYLSKEAVELMNYGKNAYFRVGARHHKKSFAYQGAFA